ncbi:hypothetical protein SDC9_104110 [bioreactor metagenome]|uniref:Uncharacterized protein n=1 Tax=bioreactor metagenome TaxID=1076179 RepID=A0A645AWY2_9ZZZZ
MNKNDWIWTAVHGLRLIVYAGLGYMIYIKDHQLPEQIMFWLMVGLLLFTVIPLPLSAFVRGIPNRERILVLLELVIAFPGFLANQFNIELGFDVVLIFLATFNICIVLLIVADAMQKKRTPAS